MKKEGRISFAEGEISDINHLIKVLSRHIEKFEAAYKRKDPREFNILKKEILQIEKKIHALIK
ncbi:MAG: hypothetical protein AABX50_02500 [Nanoarchaeota archaeon]